MNILAHILAVIALFWLATFCVVTLTINALGLAVGGLGLLFLYLTFSAIVNDWDSLKGGDD